MLSIITPSLNSVKFIEKNIKSIQELKVPYEHIIVDGGSTDGTIEIVKKYDKVILISQVEKRGMYHAIDLGFNSCKGDAITWVNSDDKIIKEGFEAMYAELKKFNYDFVYSNGFFVDKDNKVLSKIKGTIWASFFLKRGIMPFIQPATLYKKNLYVSIGGLNYKKFRIVGDFDLFHRMAKQKDVVFKRVSVDSILFLKYGESLGDKNGPLAAQERVQIGLPYKWSWVNIVYKIGTIIS